MRKGSVRKWTIGLALIIVFLVVEPAGATTISDLQEEQKELEEQQDEIEDQMDEEEDRLAGVSGQISDLEGDADLLAGEIDAMDEDLVVLLASVDMITQEITEKEEAIQETTLLYDAAKAEEEAQNEAMKQRIRFMYEEGEMSYLELFMESASFSELLNKVDYVEVIYEYDRELLEQYQKAREETLVLKEQLEAENAELIAQQHELEEEQAEMERLMEEKKAQFEDFAAKIAQARRQAAVYRETIKAQSEQIRKLEAEREAVRQEEIAAVQAAEEAKRAAANVSAESGSSDNGNEGSSHTGYGGPNAFSGSRGQQIAGYACQFIGNPYVPGGTSLTEGADCSGFVWRVYKDFGYSVPRTSWSFRDAGTSVSYQDAQPGDIVCYAGHVGIYIGNGNIVHASTQKTGIKITHATYKEILSVRRIV